MKRAWSRKNIWEATPRRIKSVLGKALGIIPTGFLLGSSYRKWSKFLADAEWWDADHYGQYQFERLKDILTLAYDCTKFYGKTFREVGFEPGDFKDLSDLSGLPTIDKASVRENLEDMLTVPKNQNTVDYVSTSGTGGTPLSFYMDSSRHPVEFAHLCLSWARVGYKPGMPIAVLRGKPVAMDRSGMYYEYDPLLRHHIYSSFHLTSEQMGRIANHMQLVRPRFLHAYPSSAYILSRFMVAHGLQFPDSMQAILLESESVYDYQRNFILEHFPVKILSSYGHTEKLVMATGCEACSFYHVWPTYGYCEILSEDGSPTPQGETGEIVGTGFINRTLPFIRYRTGDYAVLHGTSCPQCHRNHMVLSCVRGHRSQEFLVTKGGRAIIAWTALNMHDDTFDGIAEFQFVQETPGRADLYLVPATGKRRYDLNRIKNLLDSKIRGQIDLRLMLCNQIAPAKSGKRPLVVQRTKGIEHLLGTFVTNGTENTVG